MIKLIAYALLSFIPCVVFAEEHEHHHDDEGEHREHQAHQHGTATLNWVLEGKHLQVLLDSPAMNIIGFEHQPHDEHEKQQLKQAMVKLNQPNQVIIFKGGDCQADMAKIANPFTEEEHNHGQEEHSDITAEYLFSCDQPSELQSVNVMLFDTFSGFEKIDAQWIIGDQQGAATLTADNHELQLR